MKNKNIFKRCPTSGTFTIQDFIDHFEFSNFFKLNFYLFFILSKKYIKKCISENKKPNFQLISIEKLKSKLPEENHIQHELVTKYLKFTENKLNTFNVPSDASVITWNSNETIKFYLDSIIYLPQLKDCNKIYFKIAIYHGADQVTNDVYTDKIDIEKKSRDALVKVNKSVDMNVKVMNLHRCAKLCICLYSISKKKKVVIIGKKFCTIFSIYNEV